MEVCWSGRHDIKKQQEGTAKRKKSSEKVGFLWTWGRDIKKPQEGTAKSRNRRFSVPPRTVDLRRRTVATRGTPWE